MDLSRRLQLIHDIFRRLDSARTEDTVQIMTSLKAIMSCANQELFRKDSIATIDKTLADSKLLAEQYGKEQDILESLRFEGMSTRYDSIVEAHSSTFDWIFEPSSRWPREDPRSRIQFFDWLCRGNGVYWLSGKPGSGKSTLMKFLYSNPRTRAALQVWAKPCRLILSNFYFWVNGTEMQRTLRGLLQQLLFGILNQCPDLIPYLCPDRLDRSARNWSQDTDWPLTKLQHAIKLLPDAKFGNTKFCLFIDGLDEYSGDHYELIQTIDNISKAGNIKLCLSSRPWNCFEHAFGRDNKLKMYLQDLTRDDIARFAEDKLREFPRLAYSHNCKHIYEQLASEIVNRAQGVFLWVYLVIKSLRDGLLNGDSPQILYQRLLELPTDLEAFFERMIQSVDKVYEKQMAATFQVMLRTPNPLPMILYPFIENTQDNCISLDAPSCMHDDISSSPINRRSTLSIMQNTIERQFSGRYKGLLETVGPHEDASNKAKHVTFFHRTIRDFLQSAPIQEMFQRLTGSGFDACLTACTAYLRVAKAFPGLLTSAELSGFMFFARCAQEDGKPIDLQLLEQMNYAYYSRKACGNLLADGFFGYAVRFGLIDYVRYGIKDDPSLLRHYGDTFLGLALGIDPLRKESVDSKQFCDMIKLLLFNDVDPNRPRHGIPFFRWFLSCCTKRESLLMQPLRLLLRHEANINEIFLPLPLPPPLNVSWYESELLGSIRGSHANPHAVIPALSMLFEFGLKPNCWISNPTKTVLWEDILAEVVVSQAKNGCSEEFCVEIIELFLQNGADPEASVKMNQLYDILHFHNITSPKLTFSEIVDRFFDPETSRRLRDILNNQLRHKPNRGESSDEQMPRRGRKRGRSQDYKNGFEPPTKRTRKQADN